MKLVQRAIEFYIKHLGQVNKKLNNLKEEAQKEQADKGKSNNDVPNFSDIDALVKINPEKNVVRPLLVISFAFVKYMPHKANIWGI